MRRSAWLWRFLSSRQGLLTVGASATASLAVGLLPNLVQAVPGVGDAWWWWALVALGAVIVLAVCASLLHGKEGVGIVLYMGEPGWDDSRLPRMRADALERHASCFTVNVAELLGPDQDGQDRDRAEAGGGDRLRFAYRVMQARMREEAAAGQLPEYLSLYVTVRHPDAYRLGDLLRDQRHGIFQVVAQSEESGRGFFPAVGLHSELTQPPTDADIALLREVLERDPETEGPEWQVFEQPDGFVPRRIALVLPVTGHNAAVAEEACAAARSGSSEMYRFPGPADPGPDAAPGSASDANRCAGALVFATKPGNLPDSLATYEALIRYVNHHWRRTMSELGEGRDVPLRGWLFTDGPVPLVLALGRVLGRQTDLVPRPPRPRPGMTEGARR